MPKDGLWSLLHYICLFFVQYGFLGKSADWQWLALPTMLLQLLHAQSSGACTLTSHKMICKMMGKAISKVPYESGNNSIRAYTNTHGCLTHV